MAKIENPKARKEYMCSKCGEVIKIGDTYFKGSPFRAKPIIRCMKCGLRSWELSSSDYVLSVGKVCEDWREDYELGEGTAQEIADELSNILDNVQDSYDNLPENFQYSENGERLQERIDNLENAISELEAIDYENIKEGELGDSDYDSLTDEAKEELDENINNALAEEIDSALSSLEY